MLKEHLKMQAFKRMWAFVCTFVQLFAYYSRGVRTSTLGGPRIT